MKYVVDGEWLDALAVSGCCAGCPVGGACEELGASELSCSDILVKLTDGKVVPITPAQERAGNEEEWVVVNREKLMELLDDENEHSPGMRLFKKQESLKHLTLPEAPKGGESCE